MKTRNRFGLLVVAVLALTALAGLGTALGATAFSDVPSGHPFYADITRLAALEIVGGFPDGTYRPDDQVTRQQFAKIIVLATDEHTAAVDNEQDPTFADVTPGMGVPYPFDYIEEAAKAGFVLGSKGRFDPASNITRAQLALIVVRAGGSALADPPAGYQAGFTDLPGFAAAEIAKAKFNGILDGKTTTTFDPYAFATRGQVAKIVSHLLDEMAAGRVIGTTAQPSADFQQIADRLNAVLALGYNTTNPDVVAKALFDANPANDPFVLDTREPADYAKGHIPGAVNIPLLDLPQALLDADPRIPMDKEIIIASYWGDDGDMANLLVNVYRIADPAAQKTAIDAKTPTPYPKSTVIFQGMTSWSFARDLVPEGTRFDDALAAGVIVKKGIETGTNAGVDQGAFPTFSEFGVDAVVTKALLRAKDYFGGFANQFDIQVYPSALAQNLEDGNAANDPQLISVRAAAHYSAGHIPGAINIPYQKVADVANFTKFVDPNRPVIAYCYTGHTGGIAVMALGILGYDVRNLLYGINGWNVDAPGSGQLKNFDLLKTWDFPVNDGGADDLPSLADFTAPSGCASCHSSLTGIFYDREVANPPATGEVVASEGEG